MQQTDVLRKSVMRFARAITSFRRAVIHAFWGRTQADHPERPDLDLR
jgi:hypothetical protein